MKLEDYLNEQNVSVQDFAEKIGVGRRSVYDYCGKKGGNKTSIPRPNIMKKIIEETEGKVTIADFYEEV